MDDPDDPVFLSTLYLGRDALTARHPELEADADGARVLRSVLMKPEHEHAVDVAARARRGPGARRARMTRRGLVALGDSITNGHGEPALGVPMQSWAQWLAEALELPFTKLARDGALRARRARRAGPAPGGPLRRRLPLRRRQRRALDSTGTPPPTSEACARSPPRWRRAASGCCCARCPADLGRPRAAPKPRAASAIVRAVAREHGAALADLDDLAGAPWLLPDAVHPTARGQLEIADRAARALGAPRCRRRSSRSTGSRRARARFAARWGVLLARDLRRRAVERVRAP